MHVQVITFQLNGPSVDEYLALCESAAPQWAAIPGLISKTWLRNDETNTYGGVYFWESQSAMEDYIASDLFKAGWTNPSFANATSTDFGVIEEPSRVTRGLAAATV